MAYSPPTSPIEFDFLIGGYSPPAGAITFELVDAANQTISGTGFSATQFGGATVYASTQFVVQAGYIATAFGATLVATDQQFTTTGQNYATFGTAVVGIDRTYAMSGFDAAAFGPDVHAVNRIALEFLFPYVEQSQPIVLDFVFTDGRQGFRPDGIDALAFGGTTISNASLGLFATGIDGAAFGAPLVYNETQIISAFGFVGLTVGDVTTQQNSLALAAGFVATAVGTATVYNLTQYLTTAGAAATSFGTTVVANVNQEIRAVPGFESLVMTYDHVVFPSRNYVRPTGSDSAATGSAFVGHELQYAYVPAWFPSQIGATTVINRNATIYPVGVAGVVFGTTSVGTNQYITPAGYVAFTYGGHEIGDTRQRLYVAGAVTSAGGNPVVRNINQTIHANYAGVQTEFGDARVHNLWQFLYASTRDEDSPEQFAEPFVYNLIQTIGAFGNDFLRIRPYHAVRLTGEALLVSGDRFTEFGDTLVSHLNRSIYATGFDALRPEDRLQVYTADALYPAGADSAAFGTADITSNLQQIDPASVRETLAIGTPFVAYAVRRIIQGTAIEGVVAMPTVNLRQQYVRPAGIDSYATSAAYLYIRRLIVTPLGYDMGRVGNAVVRNRNVELGMYGVDQARVGTQFVRNEFERYSVQGYSATLWGEHSVADTDRTIYLSGFSTATVSHLARMVKNPPDPPGPRLLLASGEVMSEIGAVDILNKAISPAGEVMTRFGVTKLLGHTIAPLGIFEDWIADTRPSLNPTLYIRPIGMTPGVVPKHDMQPRTIWATTATPAQAVTNHPGDVYHPIGTFDYDDGGMAHVMNRVQYATARSLVVMTSFGDPIVGHRPAYIRPAGQRLGKFGIPILPSGVNIETFGAETAQFGLAAVEHYIDPSLPRYLRPGGDVMLRTGAAWVSTSPQDLAASGASTQAIGLAWVSLELPPIQGIGMPSAVAFGDPLVAYRIRSLLVEGADTVTTGESVGNFRERMRVFSRRCAYPVGIAATAFGTPLVGVGTRYIGVPSIVGTVGMPVVRNQINVTTQGWVSATFGGAIVDVVEAGKIKPVGSDFSVITAPALRETINPAGLLSTLIGDARPANAITFGAGDESTEFGHAVAVGDGDHTCGMAARGFVPAGFTASVFGSASL